MGASGIGALIAAIQSADYLTEPPANYFCAEDYAAQRPISLRRANQQLLTAWRDGKIDRVQVKEPNSRHPVFYYGLKT